MKAWVYRKEKADSAGVHIFQEDAPTPRPGANQVLLKVEKVSVCGTDESLFKGDLKKVPDGIIPGHEFYGEIIELGREVNHVQIGQKVAGESHYTVPDTTGEGIIGLWGPEISKGELMPPIHGAYAEYLVLPSECAHPVPGEYVSEGFWPSLFEAIGNDYFLVKQVLKISPLRSLGVFGCGPHGLFAQIFAKNLGISHIAAFEVDSFRRQFAAEMNAAEAIYDPRTNLLEATKDFTGGKLFDATLDMVGKQGQGFASCCKTTRDGGTVFLFGLFTGSFAIDSVPGNEIIFKMKTLDYSYEGKKLRVIGITGREGIWDELIDNVCKSKQMQHHLMKPIHVMGTLDQLGEDTRNLRPDVMKRAYYPFK